MLRCCSKGLLRYANNSNYKNDVMIRKEVYVGNEVLKELERIVKESDILAEDDHNWFVCTETMRQDGGSILSTRHCTNICAGM